MGKKRDTWKKERADLERAKTGAKNAKADAEAKVLQIQGDLDMVQFMLSITEAQLKEAEAKASLSEKEWFERWQTSEACDDYCARLDRLLTDSGKMKR